MKDVTQTLKDTIYTLLNKNVTYNGNNVKVFKHTPKNTEAGIVKGRLYYYIEIGDISDTETPNNADTFCHDVSMDLQVVVGFPGIGSSDVYSTICNQVMQLIQPTKGGRLSLGSDFFNVYIEKEIDFTTEEQDIHKKVIRTIRYRLQIDEV